MNNIVREKLLFIITFVLLCFILYYIYYKKSRIITKRVVKKLVHKRFGGRKAGTVGMDKCRNYLCALFSSIQLKNVYFAPKYRHNFSEDGIQYTNLIGYLPSTKVIQKSNNPYFSNLDSNNFDNENCIVFMAHYDHLGIKKGKLYPGANDNASGVYAVLSVAEKLYKTKYRKHSYIFILTDGEELGLLGAKKIFKKKYLQDVKLIINFDMIGGCKGNSVGVVPIVPNQPILESSIHLLNKDIETNNVSIDLTIKNEKAVERTDLSVFTKKGYSGIDIGYCLNDYYHTPEDTIEKLNFNTMNSLVTYLLILVEKYIE